MSTNQSQVWRTIRSMDGRAAKKNKTLAGMLLHYVDDKDKANRFGKRYPTERKDRNLRQNVRNVRKHKFLGVTILDSKKRVNILKCLAGKDWGNLLECQRKIYLQCIRSCLEYASSKWDTWISGLRAITELANCRLNTLWLETKIEKVFIHLHKNDDITCDKYECLPEENSRMMLFITNICLQTRMCWSNSTTDKMEDIDVRRKQSLLQMHHGESLET